MISAFNWTPRGFWLRPFVPTAVHDDAPPRRYCGIFDWSDEDTDDPLNAERRNFYKVEKWSRDGMRVVELLFGGTNLDKARRIFERTAEHQPRGGLRPACPTCPELQQQANTSGHMKDFETPGDSWHSFYRSC
jgi:hypothetical protein